MWQKGNNYCYRDWETIVNGLENITVAFTTSENGLEFAIHSKDYDTKINFSNEDVKVLCEEVSKYILEKEEIKPCPHCGGHAIWRETNDEDYPYQIICKICGCGTDETDDKEEAIKDWNRRV